MKRIISILLALVMAFCCVGVCFAADEAANKPFENSSFFTSGEYTLHYRTYEPIGEPKNQIMLLHGFGLSTVSFEGLAKQYADAGYKTVLVDLPDFGYSTRETAHMKLVSREKLVYALMKELGGTWILGGHSMGGGVASNVAIEYPDTVKGLVLIAPQTNDEMPKAVNMLMRSFLVRSAFELVIRFACRFPFAIRLMLEMSFSDKEFAAQYDTKRITDPLKQKGTGAAIAVMASHTNPTDAQKFGELSIPIIIVTAKNDKIADQSRIDALINAAPEKLVVHEFEQGGHMIMEYNPQGIAEATLGTIAQCD